MLVLFPLVFIHSHWCVYTCETAFSWFGGKNLKLPIIIVPKPSVFLLLHFLLSSFPVLLCSDEQKACSFHLSHFLLCSALLFSVVFSGCRGASLTRVSNSWSVKNNQQVFRELISDLIFYIWSRIWSVRFSGQSLWLSQRQNSTWFFHKLGCCVLFRCCCSLREQCDDTSVRLVK